jgi:transcriptional regulator with XRE-family HTH domain
MVTRIHRHARPRKLFLKEHREAKGVSAEAMAGRLDIERESVYRLEREAHRRMNIDKLHAYADALNIEPAALWQPPGTISLDDLASSVPTDLRAMATDAAADVLRRFAAPRR